MEGFLGRSPNIRKKERKKTTNRESIKKKEHLANSDDPAICHARYQPKMSLLLLSLSFDSFIVLLQH